MLNEAEIIWVCLKAKEVLSNESTLLNIPAPVKICGKY
jgi:hypothetical protein